MNLLSITIERNPEELQKQLWKQIDPFKDEGVLIDENVTYNNSLYTIDYYVKMESIKSYSISDFVNIFKYCVANALYEYIKNYEECRIISKLIDYDYYYFNIKERIEIQDIMRAKMDKINNGEEHNSTKENNKKFDMIQTFVDYFKNNSQLNLKGFITFRLQRYILDLQEVIEKAVEEFLMDKEYDEFINLLRYFVDIQEAKIDTVHILLEEDSKYKLYNQHGNLINNEYLNMIANEMVDKDINYEDLLISSLITVAPNRLFIHEVVKTNNEEVIRTISRVFIDKVTICDDCDWCKVKVKAEKE
ncbi:MAG: putative sporulation protein YtxC [Clostridiaceae bacterium]|nr:putative sporulation protein YtxC [Clostridiaceae bacterium]